MATRRRYTKQEKAEAVAKAAVTSTEAAAEELGIPRRTLGYWTTLPEFAELRQKTREGVADMFWAAIQIGVDQVAQGLLNPEAPLRDKATALGILYDKHALMTGEATSRSEHRDIADVDADAARALARRLAGIGGTAPAQSMVLEPRSNGASPNGKH